MAVNWWERVDREEPIERAHALWGSPGLLVVRGSDATERGVVAKLIEERLGESGQCARGIDTSYGAPLAGALLDVWSKLAPREPGTIPDWVRYAGRPVPELCRRLADYQATQHRPGAVVLEEVDSTDPLGPVAVDALRQLAQRTKLPVVVTSREESHTRWLPGAAVDGISIVGLRPFHAREVSECLQRFRPDLSFDERRRLIENARAGAAADAIQPLNAYMVLRAAA